MMNPRTIPEAARRFAAAVHPVYEAVRHKWTFPEERACRVPTEADLAEVAASLALRVYEESKKESPAFDNSSSGGIRVWCRRRRNGRPELDFAYYRHYISAYPDGYSEEDDAWRQSLQEP